MQNTEELQKKEITEQKQKPQFQKEEYTDVSTLEDWVQIWLHSILLNAVKESTRNMYADIMEHHIFPPLGDKKLEELDSQMIQRWIESLREQNIPGCGGKNMAEGTVRNTLSVLSGCMRDAQRYGLIRTNPCLESAWSPTKKIHGAPGMRLWKRNR